MSDTCNTSKDDDLDLLGDDVEAFSGSQADLEGAAENLFLSPPGSQPLHFESLSLRTPQTVPPTPGTALQNKIESKLEKSLGNQLNIQPQEQIGVFQVSMREAMKSLRGGMQSMKKASKVEVDKTSTSTSKAGPSKPSVELSDPNIHIRTLGLPITRMLNLRKLTSVVLHFHHGSPKVYSQIMAPSTQIISANTWILNPNTRNNLKCVFF